MTDVGPGFVSGQQLSERFYREEVRPVLEADFPGLAHSAALLGRGSEVLGFDDHMSRDHNWEPRVMLFLRDDDHARHGPDLEQSLAVALPSQFHGYATDHSVWTLRSFFQQQLEIDIDNEMAARDWLTLAEHRLLMVTAGAVYHDQVGLQAVRERFGYYPRDVWIYLLIAAWWRVHPEVNLVGRSGFVGDELGSALIGAQLVHGIMRLCFLMEKQYAPYSKWFGTAFSRLDCAAEMSPVLSRAVRAQSWQEREAALMAAYEQLGAMHNALSITPPVTLHVERMWDRPFPVSWGDFPVLLEAEISDPAVRRIAEEWPTGGIDQVRDVLWGPGSRERLLRLMD
jgi:hypothetical protein